jgi:uncharacterized protein YndB with AHSA1/START domain
MIRKAVFLECDPTSAFALFTERASEWWPPGRRHTGDSQSEIHLLPSGRFWERASDGREVELGRVRVWEPPHRLVLDFYPGTDPQHPTEVTVAFVAEGDGTRVTIDHGATPASQDLWKQRVARFEQSWELMLAALAAAARPSLFHR